MTIPARRLLAAALGLLALDGAQAQSIDTTWNGNGKRSIWFDLPSEKWDEATDAVRQPDGKIVIVGFARRAPVGGSGDVSDTTLLRLTSSGANDSSFAGGAGRLSANFSSGGRQFDRANAVALDASGRILVAGSMETSSGRCGFVARYSAAGVLDAGYGYGGSAVFCDGTGGEFVYEDIAVDAQGRAVVAGTRLRDSGTLDDGLVVRLTAQGSLDASFTGGSDAGNSVGHRFLSLGIGAAYDDELTRIAVLPSGELILAGSSRASGNDYDFMLYKLNANNGALVPGFGAGGRARLYSDATAPGKSADLYDRLADLIVLSDGRMRMAGNCRWAYTGTIRPCMIGALANGGFDLSVPSNTNDRPGTVSTVLNLEGSTDGSEATSIGVLPDGEVWIAGTQYAHGTLPMQIAAQGIEGYGGGFNVVYTAVASWSNAMVIDPQGRMLLVGGATVDAAGTDVDQATVRYRP